MQERLYGLLRWFHEFCRANDLRYYVYGGTCLGAIRHGDIIPWDDDADVAMPRTDFNRFRQLMIERGLCADTREISPEILDETFGGIFEGFFGPYVLETPLSDASDFTYGYGKLFDVSTTLIEVARRPIKRGVFLDIFALDGMGDTYEEGCATMRYLLRKRNLYLATVASKRTGRAWYKNLAVSFGGILGRILRPKRYLRKLIEVCEKKPFDGYAYVGQLFNLNGDRSVFEKELFGVPRTHSFHSFTVNVPARAEEYLTREYGDWKKMPPVEQRVAKHELLELSFKTSYLE